MTTQTLKRSLEELQRAVINDMLDKGIQKIEVSYYGSGDNSDGVELICFDEHGQCDADINEDQVYDALWNCIKNAGHSGWQDNEGGSGTLTFMSTGEIDLVHNDNYENTEYFSYENVLQEQIEDFEDIDNKNAAHAYKTNVNALMTAMQFSHVAKISINYDGGGDSGGIETLDFLDENGSELEVKNLQVNIMKKKWVYDKESGGYVESYQPEQTTIEKLAEIIFYDSLNAYHCGWENDGGGFGEFTFRSDGSSFLEHNDRYMDSEESTCEWVVTFPNEKHSPARQRG